MTVLHEFRAYLLIAVVALLSWWWMRTQELPGQQKIVMDSSPDLISKGYYKMPMDSDGAPKSELWADEMQHFAKDGTTHFTRPLMHLFKPQQAPWVIKSETAIMAADGDNLQLNGKTLIDRAASANNRALTIETADLRVKLSTNYAETQAYTELISRPDKTTGKGMEVTFVSPINLKLLSSVKGYYELNK